MCETLFCCPNLDATGDLTTLIPYSVVTIADDAFYGCSKITTITIPDSVTSIGDCVFEDCVSLTSVTIPSSVSSIGGGAFSNCSSLQSIQIPDSITSIDGLFQSCTKLKSIKIPNSVTYIGQYSFENSGLTTISIPDSVTKIGSGAFAKCSNLKEILIPKSVTQIEWNGGEGCFTDCDKLRAIYYTGTEEQWKKLVTNEDGDDMSDLFLDLNSEVAIYYNYVPLIITSQPADVMSRVNVPVTFTVKAQGEGLTYRWFYSKADEIWFDGSNLWTEWEGMTSATITATSDWSWNGMQVYCEVRDKCGKTKVSDKAKVTITTSIQEIFPGDPNGDGKVNGKDATRLMQYLAGWDVTLGK